MNKVLYSSKNQNCCTPQAFFDKLNAEFNFVLDAAATDKSAKCRLYFTLEKNGLMQDWNCDGAVFCNPPYGCDFKSQNPQVTKSPQKISKTYHK